MRPQFLRDVVRLAPTKTYPDGERGRYHCRCGCGRVFIGRKDDDKCPACAHTGRYPAVS